MHFLFVIMLSALCPDSSSTAFQSLVAVELVFDADCAREGIRASFISYFADSAIAFSPAPYVFQTWAKSAPPPKDPLFARLHWEPISGGISYAGDMGFTTGPYRLAIGPADSGVVEYGMFFTVWEKQADGVWKVMVDIGTQMPEDVKALFGTPCLESRGDYSPSAGAIVDREGEGEKLKGEDEKFFPASRATGTADAYKEMSGQSIRLYREGAAPILGASSVFLFWPKAQGTIELRPLRARVALSGDFGYTYGSYSLTRDGTTPEDGFYCHLWRKSAEGVWKLTAAIFKPHS